VLHRFTATDPRYRKRLEAFNTPQKWAAGIAALNAVILRLANGEETDPRLRRLLVRALSSGEVQLVPERPPGWTASYAKRDKRVIDFIQGEIRKHPKRQRKVIYADAQKVFGLGRTQLLKIWSEANRPV